MRTSLSRDAIESLTAPLRAANADFARRYPGDDRTPPAGPHRLRRRPPLQGRHGAQARRARAAARSTSTPRTPPRSAPPSDCRDDLARRVYARVSEKLRREPVEDFRHRLRGRLRQPPRRRGRRPRRVRRARGRARASPTGTLPPFIGIRIKPFSRGAARRAAAHARHLPDARSSEARAGSCPANFVVTLPKITIPEQVAALADLLDALERALGLARGRAPDRAHDRDAAGDLRARTARSPLPRLVEAGRGRCVAGALRHLRLHGVAAASPRRTST